MNANQLAAFQANAGFTPSAVAGVLLGAVFATLLLWGVWALRTAYVGWSEQRISQRQFVGVAVRFIAMYVVLTFSCSPNAKAHIMNLLSYRLHSARMAVLTSASTLAMLPTFVRADLPTLEDPSRGTGSGIMETLRNYGYDIVMLVALLVVASMFVGVCYHAYGTYAEIHTGRKTWGQFGLTVAVGAVLLVVGVWLLTEATGVL